jgi:acyl-CoA thioesterase-1
LRLFVPHPSRLAGLFVSGLTVVLTACGMPPRSTPPTTPPGAGGRIASSNPQIAAPLRSSYAALGASETYGIGAAPVTRGYAYQVARALGARHFRDTGIPGATLSQAYDTELTSALAGRPELCTLFFGVNDLRAQVKRAAFLQDLHDLAATLRRAHASVLIIGLPDLSYLPAARSIFADLHEITVSWNRGMAQVAKQTGSAFLDLSTYSHELATHPAYIASDGLHPSNRGHARIAQVVLGAIRAHRLWKSR